jgi:hypothetical protein
VILLLRERAVEVAALPFAVARGLEGDRAVDRLRVDDRGRGVVEVELLAAEDAVDIGGEVVRGERTRGDDRRTITRTSSMRGSASIAAVMCPANCSRSTESAPPEGTALRSAASMTSEPRRRISSFRRPAGVVSRFDFSELLQTSSARSPVLWAGVRRTGRIS